ncbi:MAG TPA: glycine C-acetyltransferase [Cyclobacteriaceae bacterium]
MYEKLKPVLIQELAAIRSSGLYKEERIITTPQGPVIRTGGKEVINFCSNNYLGLSSDPRVIEAAKHAIDTHGYGLSSVRFICGTQDLHKTLEQRISEFLGTDDTILYAAAFDANGGVFEPLFGEKDAIISDALNHASVIDGIRLCKARRYRYEHNSMESLESKLNEARDAGAEQMIIVTDGAFSMDGTIAQLDKICDLAEAYEALVMSDESHATGFLGKTGRGVPEYCGVMDRVDIITGTLGKALGGASGGFTSGRKEIIEMLRQRSRPYLFSNTLAPAIAGASIAVFDILSETTALRDKLERNTAWFRKAIAEAGFDVKPGNHPIVPIMLYDARLAQEFAAQLLEEGIYVVGFFYPVVPQGQARIRVQLSAAHEMAHMEAAVEAFRKVGKALGVIPARSLT